MYLVTLSLFLLLGADDSRSHYQQPVKPPATWLLQTLSEAHLLHVYVIIYIC
jgi:hypothetical protein